MLSFQANLGSFCIGLMKIGPILLPVLENFENMTHVNRNFRGVFIFANFAS